MKLSEQIKSGESRTLEFKEMFGSSKVIAKTLVAFANGAGGKLIIGVKDDKTIKGINENNIFNLKDKVANIVHDLCMPLIIPEIYVEKLGDKIVLIIKIYSGNFKPYYLKGEGKQQGTYIRIGATNKKADILSIKQLEREQRNISFDAELCYEPLKVVDFGFLQARLNKKMDETALLNLNLVKLESGKKYYNNAALILAGNLENSFVSCARFKGESSEVFIDRKEFRGDIFSQLENVEMFLKNHLMLHGEINGFIREDNYEIPIIALREAVINAFVHRDYSVLGSNIKIAIFDHQVKITSPGVLPSSISLENIMTEERSEIRNPVIAYIFKELNLIEQWGTGFTKIRNACEQAGIELPIVRESANFLQIIFKRVKEGGGKVAKKWRKSGEKSELNEQEERIVKYLNDHSKITSSDAADLLSVKISRSKIILSQLVKKNIILKYGKTKNVYYMLR